MTKSELIKFLKPYKRTMFGDPKYGEVSVAEIIEALEEQNSGVNSIESHCRIREDGYMTEEQMQEYKAMIKRKSKPVYPRWIPCSVRLPEDGLFVIVCNDEGISHVAKFERETWEWYLKYCLYDFDVWDIKENGEVVAWMPLPTPYKENCDELD